MSKSELAFTELMLFTMADLAEGNAPPIGRLHGDPSAGSKPNMGAFYCCRRSTSAASVRPDERTMGWRPFPSVLLMALAVNARR